MCKDSDRLDRFAEAHFVGQDSVHSVLIPVSTAEPPVNASPAPHRDFSHAREGKKRCAQSNQPLHAVHLQTMLVAAAAVAPRCNTRPR
jgi:hypothetical protein